MVRQPDPGELRPQTGVSLSREKQLFATAVKLEVDDPIEEEHGPENKRWKCSSSLSSWNSDARGGLSDQPKYNPLDEPSPLGLRLRKSPSLVDLIQMRLSQGNSSKALLAAGGSSDGGIKKETRVFSSSSGDKIKASNFPATLLKIGGWEYVSRYEGDLVAKCYFAKRKLVWEVLEGGLKSKIEVQWSDIMDIKANYPENNSGTLDIVISRQPLFFRETNPQPRKHTLWQATSDFTGGQASIHRRHFLQVPQGLLGKHFEKLMQCDSRLHSLSRQPEIILDSPFFESSRCSTFDDQGAKLHRFDDLKGEFDRSSFQGFLEMSSPSACPSSSRSGDFRDHTLTPDGSSHDALSPSSAMESGINEESTSSGIRELRSFPKWDQLKLPGIHPSMSMTDLVNHIENCISQQRTASGNSCFPGISTTEKDVLLDDITQYLLSDSQNISPSDENSLMSRVNSLCCLLQKEPPSATSAAPSLHPVSESVSSDKRPPFAVQTPEERLKDDVAAQNSIPRKESYGDLLHHLPRIASLPQFFFSVSDDSADKAR